MPCDSCTRLCDLHFAEDPATGLTEFEQERLLWELLRAAGETGMSETDLEQAQEAFSHLRTDVSLFQLWRLEKASVGWSAETQDLTWRAIVDDRLDDFKTALSL